MGIVTAQELYTCLKESTYHYTDVNSAIERPWYSEEKQPAPLLTESFTMEDVEKALDTLHSRIIRGQFLTWKSLRPWDIVDFNDILDPAKAWIGWEVETGWDFSESRSAAISELFERYNHVATDNEGPVYGVEMTWSPSDNGYDGQQHPLLFVAEMAEKHEAHDHHEDSETGTHVNISTPTYRLLTDDQAEEVVNALNRALSDLSGGECKELFGRRRLYGGFFQQRSWVEGKMFNTTYDEETAKGYIEVAQRLASLMERLSVYMTEECPDYMRRAWASRVVIADFLKEMRGTKDAASFLQGAAVFVDGYVVEHDEYCNESYCDCGDCDCDDCCF